MDPTVIAAFSGVLVALTGLIGAFTVLWRELKKNTATTNVTHDLVNSRMDAMVDSQKTMEERQRSNEGFQTTLIQHLKSAGMSIPVNPADQPGVE